tara:strand:+ start:56 stop:481 length:426 start_codon:yes stop_codon:yes gene_type:complete
MYCNILVLYYEEFKMSEKIADFRNAHKGTSYAKNAQGKLVAQSNWESVSEIDLYGAVYGTLTVEADINDPDANSGECSWAGEGFSPDGTRTVGFQSGTWEKIGNHKWALKMAGKDSKSGAVYTESEIELETLIWSGTVYTG